MKKLFTLSILTLFLYSFQHNTSIAQLSGTLTIPGSYASISAAISSLNALGVGAGGVTFNVAAGYVEVMTQAIGSYTINIVSNPPNASNPVVFQKSGIGANPLVQSNVLGTGLVAITTFGSNGDAFFKLNGTDYITFDGIDLLEGYTGAVTTQKMEYGFMLCRASSTDGCKNVTIKNCTMTFYLTAATSVSAGVYAASYNSTGTITSATTIAGRHENIFIDGCSIYSTITGMYFNGTADAIAPYNLYDNNIQVGVTTPNTMICGARTTVNTASAVYGIYIINSDSIKFNNNTIRMNTGTNNVTHYGIFTSTGTNSNADIINNNISDTSSGSTAQQSGIVSTFGAAGTNNTININNNTIQSCRYFTATSATVTYIQNLGAAFTININGNTINDNTIGNGTTTATGTQTGILNSAGSITAGATLTIQNNTVSNLSRSQSVAGTGQLIGIQVTTGSQTTNINDNNVNSLSAGTTSSMLAGILISATITGGTINIYNNTVNNVNKTSGVTTGILYGINASQSTPTTSTYGNTISNLSYAAGGSGAVYGYYNFGVGLTGEHFYNNNVFNITNNGTGLTYGAYVATGSTPVTLKNIYGNNIYNITGGTGQTGALYVNYPATANIYKNRIYNITSTGTAGNPQTYALLCNNSVATSIYNIYNNMVHEIKAPNANNVTIPYLGVMGIWVNGGLQANVFYNTIYLDASSVGANFGSAAFWCSITPTLDLRNNILINKSTPSGAGLTVSFIRNSTSLATYSANSNNNCFYAGLPAANRLIFYDYLNSDQTLTPFQARVSPRDANSVTENTPFVNTSVSPYDLHISLCQASQCESAGAIIAAPISITTDYDGENRYNNAGYPACSTYTPVSPDIGADEFGGLFLDAAAPVITYTPLGNTSSTSNRSFTNVTITDPSGVNTTSGTRPRCYYKKSINANAWISNSCFDDCWKWVEANGTTSPFDFTIDYSKLFGCGGVSIGDQVQYFVVAQDLAAVPNVGINSGTFASQPSSVDLTSAAFPIGGTINTYNVSAIYSGSYHVGFSQPYPTLTGSGGFFEAINNGVVSGNITAYIHSDLTEPGTFALSQTTEEGAGGYTITIVPFDAVEKVISGSVANPLIRFDGSDRITVDGNGGLDATGTKYLRFRNTDVSNPTFSFINDATNNTIKNCYIEGNNVSGLGGTISFLTTTGTTGNDNNTITENDIRDRTDVSGATPLYAIYSSGTTTTLAQANSNNTISNNNIFNFFFNGAPSSGVFLLTGTTDWTISGNSLYQTDVRTTTVNSGSNPIFVSNSAGNNFVVTGNYIGGSAPLCGGSPWTYTTVTAGVTNFMYGIRFNPGGTTSATSIQGNTVANISLTINPTASGTLWFIGIFNNLSTFMNIGNITPNSVGSASTTGSITITFGTGAFTTFVRGMDFRGVAGTIQNNNIGSFSIGGTITGTMTFNGISTSGTPTSPVNITGNTIGSPTLAPVPNSIQTTSATMPAILNGITNGFATQPTQIDNNTIANFTNIGNQASSQVTGIMNTGTGVPTITNNVIHDLSTESINISTTPTTVAAIGINSSSTALGQTISANTIYALRSTTTTANNTSVFGIGMTSSLSTGTIVRNRIYDLTNTSTGTIPRIYGLNDWFGTNWTVANNQITLTNGEATDNNGYGNLPLVENNPGMITESRTPVGVNHVNRPLQGFNETKSSSNKNMNDITGPVTISQLEQSNVVLIEKTEKSITSYEKDAFINGVLIEGIHDEAGGIINYYYNSVYIGGSASSGTNNSYCYVREITGSTAVTLRNNLFFNARTNTGSATGTHYAIGNLIGGPTGWSATASNYNVFISPNSSSIANWMAVNQTIDLWRTTSLGDKQTWSTTSGSLSASSLFNSIPGGNLNIQSGNAEAWIVSGKGIAVSGQSLDFEGNSRVTTISGGCTDIGSDEFTATPPSNPQATVDNPPGSGVTSTYSLYGRTLCVVDWGAGGSSYPSSLDVRYYSGINPGNVLGGNYSNSYWNIAANGSLTGATYDITFWFGDNETYTITSPSANSLLSKYDGTWEVFSAGIGPWQTQLTWNAGTSTYNAKTTGLYAFSDFALTDATAALPVVISSFEANVNQRNVKLAWVTEHEINNQGFDIERRAAIENSGKEQYTQWQNIKFVPGHNTTFERQAYGYVDKLNTGKYQYRLKQIDNNGNFEYFDLNNPKDVVVGKPGSFGLSQNYPNPSNPKSKIDYQIPFNGKVTIKIYDLVGQEVATLVDEFKESGYYTVEFDGINLASGIYLYRIISEGGGQKFIKTLKLVLVK